MMFRALPPLLGLLLFGGALWVLHHELALYHLGDIIRHLREISIEDLSIAFLLTVLSYIVMSGYDLLALRSIDHPLPYRRVGLASFVGYAFSNNMGFALLAGGSVRYALYSAWGLTALEISNVILFCTLTLWLGFFILSGVIFLWDPLPVPAGFHLCFATVRPLGVLFLGCVSVYLVVCMMRRRPFTIHHWTVSLPRPRHLVPQAMIASLDWIVAGSVFYVLLPSSSSLSFGLFLGIFLLAQVAGVASQLPGGLGVFETTALLLLKPYLPVPSVVGALVVFRGIYYLLPLLLAAALLGGRELLRHRNKIKNMARMADSWVSVAVPWLLALVSFWGGMILLFSVSTPVVHWRLEWLRRFFPPAVTELSHFLASLVGAGLLLLARGLQRRLDAAYLLTVFLLTAGIVFSLLKGLDYEEAVLLGVMLATLIPCRKYFYRRASLLSQRFTPGWIFAIGLVLISSLWLVFFSYKHVQYSNELWWQFAIKADAARSIRAMVGVLILVLLFSLAKLLRPRAPDTSSREKGDMDRVGDIVRQSTRTYANLALSGDKRILYSRSGSAFVMYAVKGRSWVAMGDPVGPEEEWGELIWKFGEMCDRYGGWPVFYEVGQEHLHLYVDIGLALFKLGEEARVPLQNFSMEGRTRKGLRYALRRLERDGYSFEVVHPAEVPAVLPSLQVISDTWLAAKHSREKGFSMGFFDPAYLRHFPIGLAKRAGEIYAFANVLEGASMSELSVDLMRYRPEAPDGVMDFLFTHLILWGKERGFRWFSLGMAPLSGISDHACAPLWNRMGAFAFRYGSHFYNFQGLRRYKDKFGPVWQAKYLASPRGASLPSILIDITALISGRGEQERSPSS
ncbi:MAG: bifunctional lysylphosphatidylglycerol flippase/synthetase MprF [Deltaproteobacteria bacterium]|nr:bifunctional lysylphosphatidylglycerol flippase/synthetase MprF [Deltaproteobacteria bacterium]